MNKTKLVKLVATKIEFGNSTKLFYHGNLIAKIESDKITLDCCGWKTKTTKDRMNQFSHEYDLNFSVFQSKKMWFVRIGENILPFENGKIEFLKGQTKMLIVKNVILTG